MEKSSIAVEELDREEHGSSEKRTARDVNFGDTLEKVDASARPWTKLLTSILGVDQTPSDEADEVQIDDKLIDDSFQPGSSRANPQLEEVGRRIETWINATITQCTEAGKQDDENWLSSLDETESHNDSDIQCFGMIANRRMRLYGDMDTLRKKLVRLRPSSGLTNLQFDTAFDTGFLRLEDGTLCAQLDRDVCAPLTRIKTTFQTTQLVAYALVENWLKTIERANRSKSGEMDIDIYVYGSANSRSAVGQVLSEEGLYLQNLRHPEKDPGVEYMNPHMLDFDDLDLDEDYMEVDDLEQDDRRPEDLQKTMLDLCMAETNDRHFREENAYMHITVPLLPTQKQAVSFMIEREVGPIPEESRLWKWTENETSSGFRHLITGCWATEPRPETGGGILADEPGLGKTLSALSLISQRLADAHLWSQSRNEEDENPVQSPIRSRATLIIAPSLEIMTVWRDELKNFTDNSLKVLIYHGRTRCRQVERISEADIVFTTYHTLAAERKIKKSPLMSINWFRLVLDEAHCIRRQSTTLYVAVAELEACHRWCLTGTPVQNKLDDLGALLAFIRAEPFDRISMFRKYVVSPFTYDKPRATAKLSLLLNSVCMRRKIGRLKLPPMIQRYHTVELSQAEKEQYETTRDSMLWELTHGSRKKNSGTPLGKFQIQHRLRRLCNHGTFQKSWNNSQVDIRAQREDVIVAMGKEQVVRCSSCHEWIAALATNCNAREASGPRARITCDECIAELSQDAQEATEASATNSTSKSRPKDSELGLQKSFETDVGCQGYSSKIEMLMRDLNENLLDTKSIVFSSWTRSLDLVQMHLQHRNIAFMRVDGNTESAKREQIFDTFKVDESSRILLMTTGTGAYGVNLTCANRVFLLEPNWNPSVEVQAIARAQRMSQRQSVLVIRYMVRGTIEEDILNQQGSKLSIAEMGFGAPRQESL
ncbi:hypothetical protein Z517_03325 [Fonsecaea pedrosoi CBS 271.37]|uniref:DNA repair protein rad5 n=1 Tax=Fonsecaea pedrosoi CBS 271.37 TaxID=1442368 RepID=A0A0D2HI34_9EURO|nr:uncharacterized protein Z517_03325 [Fonsecaea pedrosoi CBS 271.37]KIW84079.1 hypothetical protein Z517_03325 [Fonsecaea pedrosoi CBS 271.37]